MTERKRTTVSAQEFAKLKADKAAQVTTIPDGVELIVGQRYQLANYDLVKILSMDKKTDKIHLFNFTLNCNIYPRLSTFTAKEFA